MSDELVGRQMQPVATLLDRANDLKRLPRMGWLLSGISPVESVAEHSYGVAFLSLLLVDTINAAWEAEGLGEPLNMARTLRLALIHDLAESVLTDLPKRSSELIGATAKHEAEERAMVELLADVPSGDEYLRLWQEYDVASTPEARVVKDADKLEMVHQALCYETRGQSNLDEFWRGHSWHFAASGLLYETLCARRK